MACRVEETVCDAGAARLPALQPLLRVLARVSDRASPWVPSVNYFAPMNVLKPLEAPCIQPAVWKEARKMYKHKVLFAIVAIFAVGVLALSVSGKPSAVTGSWEVDAHHSAAQLITDGTTNYGKQKLDFTLGFGRLNGLLKIDDGDPSKSSFMFRFYPASSSTAPVIAENGKFLEQWAMDKANHTMVCFHSTSVQRTPDGKVQATGVLTITRVDRNVDIEPTEAYSGPTYGPPMIHRVSKEATFVVDFPPADESTKKSGEVVASTSYSLYRENFPQLVKSVVSSYWPPVVQDEKCVNPSAGTEDYRGFRCTGTFMEAAGLPSGPGPQNVEDYSGPPSDYNAVIGNHLTIVLRMRLMAQTAGVHAAGLN